MIKVEGGGGGGGDMKDDYGGYDCCLKAKPRTAE